MVHKSKSKVIRAIVVQDRDTKEVVIFNSLGDLLKDINSDRSAEWTDYDETDWREGLSEFTQYDLVKVIKV